MVYYKEGAWHLCTEKINYTNDDRTVTKYVMSEGHDWWTDFEQRWFDTMEIHEFIPIEPTPEQQQRFQNVLTLNIPEGWAAELGDYVEFGTYPENPNNILASLELRELRNVVDALLGIEEEDDNE